MPLKFKDSNLSDRRRNKSPVSNRGRPKILRGLGHDIPTSKYRSVSQKCIVCDDIETLLKPPNKMMLQCTNCKSIIIIHNP